MSLMENDIVSIKSQIFDIIHEQDLLRVRYIELEKVKQEKLKELEEKKEV